MTELANVIKLLSGVALFLFGMKLMGNGLAAVAGDKLEVILYRMTNTPLKGILLGTAVTTVIQSSSATTVMVVGFVNSGMMKVAQAIGVIMGANIGTSITGWILCLSYIGGGASDVASLLSTATISGIVAVVGVILYMFCKGQSKHNIGLILLGFSVLMTGMQTMSSAVSVVKDSETFMNAMTMFSNPFIGILLGIGITAILQSASASVGILQALSVTGAISFSVAFPITLGIGIGAACPVLLSAIGTNRDGQRTALVYLVDDTLGMIIWGSIFYIVNAIVGGFGFMDVVMTPVKVALLNTVYRTMTVLILAPFIKQIEQLVRLLIKDRPEELETRADFELMEERFLMYPAIAIEHSRLVAQTMVKKAWRNVQRAMSLLYNYNEDNYQLVEEKHIDIDRYGDKLGAFLTRLMARELSNEQTEEVTSLMHEIGEFRRIGDHAISIARNVEAMHADELAFSDAGTEDLMLLNDLVSELIDTTVDAFENNNETDRSGDIGYSYKSVEVAGAELRRKHLKRVKKGKCGVRQTQFFDNITVDLERIAASCVYISSEFTENGAN